MPRKITETDKRYAEKTRGTKKRSWATIIYPESVKEGYMDIIAKSGLSGYISPLHDRDINPTGEKKKEHYHVIFCYENPTTSSNAKRFVQSIGGVGCEPINAIRGYARYLCHLDNPEKARYKESDVVSFGGFNYQEAISLPSDKLALVKEMMIFCKRYDIYSFAYLLEYAAEYKPDWFKILCENSSRIMNDYLKSRRWQAIEMENGNLNDVSIKSLAICEGLIKDDDTK